MPQENPQWVEGEDCAHRLSLNQHGHRLELIPLGNGYYRILVFGELCGHKQGLVDDLKAYAMEKAATILKASLVELGHIVVAVPMKAKI